MKTERVRLTKELAEVIHLLNLEEKKLADLPSVIKEMENRRTALAKEAVKLHKKLQPIPGPAEADEQTIEAADQVRRRALEVIDNLLG